MNMFNLKNKHGKATKKIVEKLIPVVYCSDVEGFIEKIMTMRDNENLKSMHVKISIDDGRSKLKISMSLVPKRYETSSDKKNKFLEGFKVTGVKKNINSSVFPSKGNIRQSEGTHDVVEDGKVGI